MAEQNSLQEARQQLQELLESARNKTIIPVRLPGQIEAIMTLLDQGKDEADAAIAAAIAKAKSVAAVSGDAGQIMHENAEFFKTAIHELRTPMTSIRGYSDMLANPGMAGAMNEMQCQLLQSVRSNAKRMESLLMDMSYVNKIRAKMLNINPKMDTLKNIALSIEKKAKPIAEELNRQLEFDIPQGLPILTTDGELLIVALLKLIENGLRYSPEETGKVTVRGAADGATLIITISDNGIGMSADEIAKLGTLFFRADNDTVRAYKGSGLGVNIAYGILDGLGASYSVESTPGQGTTFTVRIKGMV